MFTAKARQAVYLNVNKFASITVELLYVLNWKIKA